MAFHNAFHRLLRLAVLAGVALMVALPVLLGPAMPAMVAALVDATAPHRCACGMKVGRCGCPECEADRRPELGTPPSAIVRSSCDDPRFVRGAPHPMTCPASTMDPSAPVARLTLVGVDEHEPPTTFLEPARPPPRSRAA